MIAEQLTFLASLDFPEGTAPLRLFGQAGLAAKLGCTVQHLLNEVEAGALVGLDLKGKKATRRNVRIPLECYRAYVTAHLTGPVPAQVAFLDRLPKHTLREIHREITALLKAA